MVLYFLRTINAIKKNQKNYNAQKLRIKNKVFPNGFNYKTVRRNTSHTVVLILALQSESQIFGSVSRVTAQRSRAIKQLSV